MAEVKLPELKEDPIYEPPAESKIGKVVEGEVRARKKGIVGRIREVLFADDIENVREYAITDVIIPGLKHLIVDSVSMLVLGEAFGSRRERDRDRTNYATRFKYGDDRRRDSKSKREAKEEAEYDEIIFRRASDAESVLDEMYDLLKENEYVSLKDFYDLSGYKSSVFDDNWGWEDLRGVKVKRCRDGYYLTLSKPRPIE